MYPLLRTLRVYWQARRRPTIHFTDVSELKLLCKPWDIDIFLELNNGRTLTLYDLGRYDWTIRSGLHRTMQQEGWSVAVAGSTTRYRHRVRMFDRMTMKTQLIGIDQRWIYITQSIWVKDKACNATLLRICLTKGGRLLPMAEAVDVLGITADNQIYQMPAWVKAWIEGDDSRPWPPEH